MNGCCYSHQWLVYEQGWSSFSQDVRYSTTDPTSPSHMSLPRLTFEDPGEITLEWDPPLDVGGLSLVGYVVRMHQQLANSTWSTATVAYDGRISVQESALVTGLSASTGYAFSVVPFNYRSLCFYGDWGGESELLSITTSSAAVPSQPKNVRATQASGGSITVAWDPPHSAGGAPLLGYLVYFGRLDFELDQLMVITVKDQPLVMNGLQASTTFQVLVAAANSIGIGANSSQFVVSTSSPTPPGPPRNLKQLPSTSGGAVVLSWEPPEDLGGVALQFYTVFRNGNWLDITADTAELVLYSDTVAVEAQTVYSYSVAASTTAGSGVLAPEIAARSGMATVPLDPSVAVVHVSGGSATLVWTEPQDTGGTPVRRFEVFMLRDMTIVSQYAGTDSMHVFQGLLAQTEYRVIVQAVNDVGVGIPFVATVVTVFAGPPGQMKPARVIEVYGGRVRLEVEPPADFGGSAVLEYHFYLTDGTEVEAVRQTTLVYDVVGLTERTKYDFVVTASNSVGESVPSDPIEVFTSSLSAPGTVRSVYVSSTTSDTISVVWMAPADSEGVPTQLLYNIRLNASSSTGVVITNVSSPFTFGDLNPATTYRVQVQTTNTFGSGTWSDAIAVTTDPVTPGVVEFASNTVAVSEDSLFATILVTRINGSAMSSACNFHTLDGTATKDVHFVDSSGTLWFDVGVTSKNLTVRIISNNVTDDPDRYFYVVLEQYSSDSATIGDPNLIEVTITDDGDAGVLQFALSSYSVLESVASLNVTVNRLGRTSGKIGALVTAMEPASGGAKQGVDYLLPAPSLSFADQQSRSSFLIQIINDAVYQPRKQLLLSLSVTSGRAAIGTTTPIVVNILDDGDVSPPGTPTFVNISIISGGSLNVSWLTPANRGAANVTALSYVVTITSKQLGVVQTLAALTETVIVMDLIARLEYQVSVAAKSFQNTGSYSDPVTIKMGPPTPPSAPSNFAVVARTGGSATLGWARPADSGGSTVMGYSIVIQSVSDGSTVGSYDSNNTTIIVFGLSPLTDYSAVVSAANLDGLSGASSDRVQFTTRSATAPGKPDGLTVAAVTGGLLELKLAPPLDNGGSLILRYYVYLASPQSPTVFTEAYNGEEASCVIAHLAYKTEYKLKYRVSNAVVSVWIIAAYSG